MESGTNHDREFQFNSSRELNMYVLFPGQKLFVADYHPMKALEPRKISGEKYLDIHIKATVLSRIPEKSNCLKISSTLDAVVAAQQKYESWSVFLFLQAYPFPIRRAVTTKAPIRVQFLLTLLLY